MFLGDAECHITFLRLEGGEIPGVKQGFLQLVDRAERLEYEFLEEIIVEDFLKLPCLQQTIV